MTWLRPLALAAGALFLAGPIYVFSPLLGGLLVLVAAIGCVWAATLGILPRLRSRDPYDLGELRRVHHEEEVRAMDDEGALGDPQRVVCGRCLNEFPYRLGACPKCGQSR